MIQRLRILAVLAALAECENEDCRFARRDELGPDRTGGVEMDRLAEVLGWEPDTIWLALEPLLLSGAVASALGEPRSAGAREFSFKRVPAAV